MAFDVSTQYTFDAITKMKRVKTGKMKNKHNRNKHRNKKRHGIGNKKESMAIPNILYSRSLYFYSKSHLLFQDQIIGCHTNVSRQIGPFVIKGILNKYLSHSINKDEVVKQEICQINLKCLKHFVKKSSKSRKRKAKRRKKFLSYTMLKSRKEIKIFSICSVNTIILKPNLTNEILSANVSEDNFKFPSAIDLYDNTKYKSFETSLDLNSSFWKYLQFDLNSVYEFSYKTKVIPPYSEYTKQLGINFGIQFDIFEMIQKYNFLIGIFKAIIMNFCCNLSNISNQKNKIIPYRNFNSHFILYLAYFYDQLEKHLTIYNFKSKGNSLSVNFLYPSFPKITNINISCAVFKTFSTGHISITTQNLKNIAIYNSIPTSRKCFYNISTCSVNDNNLAERIVLKIPQFSNIFLKAQNDLKLLYTKEASISNFSHLFPTLHKKNVPRIKSFKEIAYTSDVWLHQTEFNISGISSSKSRPQLKTSPIRTMGSSLNSFNNLCPRRPRVYQSIAKERSFTLSYLGDGHYEKGAELCQENTEPLQAKAFPPSSPIVPCISSAIASKKPRKPRANFSILQYKKRACKLTRSSVVPQEAGKCQRRKNKGMLVWMETLRIFLISLMVITVLLWAYDFFAHSSE